MSVPAGRTAHARVCQSSLLPVERNMYKMCDILLATRQVSVHSRRTRSITSMDAARSISPVQSRSIAANGAAGQSQLTLPVPGSQNSASRAAFRRSSLSESNQRVSRLKAEISAREKDDLEIIKGDVCEWLGKTLEIEISADSFMDTLDTGVVLCKLARLIQDKARSAKEAGDKVSVAIPMETIKCQFRATKGSFFARDNSANFIKWCKKLGVNEEVMFESNGLVQQEDEKRVILCLIDVSRYAQKVHIKPPELVRLENEIDMLEMGEAEDSVFDEQPAAVTPPLCKRTTAHVKDSSSTSSSVSSHRSSSSESAVVDDRDISNEAQQSQAPSKQLVKVDQKLEKKVAIADLNPVSTIDQSPKPVADQPRTESPIPILKEKTTKKKVAQKSPRRSPHRSPHRRSPNRSQPRHCKEQQEPQCHTTKRQQQPAKKEEAPSEEKTDELVVAMVGECKCQSNKLTIRIERSGKYVVRGGRIKDKKIIHARMLSDRIMVRVGGGWKSLDHFLLVHDPCRIEEMRLYDQGRMTPDKVIARRSPIPN